MDARRLRASLLCCAALLAAACACALPTTPVAVTLHPSATPTVLALPTATLLPTPTPSPSPTPTDLYLTAADVVLYPQPVIYSGDRVTFDVTPHNLGDMAPSELAVRIYQGSPQEGTVVGEGRLGYPAFDAVPRARIVWSWDTTGLEGDETLTVWLDPDDLFQIGDENPDNNVASLIVPVLPADELPAVEAAAEWITTTTDCCVFQYLSGSAAERDLASITAAAAEGVEHVQQQLGALLPAPLKVQLVSRVIGHGGYARDGLTLSYLDRHYAGSHLETVFRHEATHVIDLTVLSTSSPAILLEGLAVWTAGGHFKPEPLPERAAALVALDWYIPLEDLANDFYRQQHEIGYLEGGALVAYLIETYGWESFLRLKAACDPALGSGAEVLDTALDETFGTGLAETEAAFLEWLAAHPPGPEDRRDVELSVYLFDTIRAYQQVYDPSAYFLEGWLPDPVEGARLGIEADFIRHRCTAENIALETMLSAAREALKRADFDQCQALLDSVNQVLERGDLEDPLAVRYLTAVQATAALGYEAQRIEMAGETARVWAIADWPTLNELTLQHSANGWILSD